MTRSDLCRWCGQSESNHRDGIGAARDCRFERPVRILGARCEHCEALEDERDTLRRELVLLREETSLMVEQMAILRRMVSERVRELQARAAARRAGRDPNESTRFGLLEVD